MVQFGEEGAAEHDPGSPGQTRRMRVATQRHHGPGGLHKRVSIMDRLHRRASSVTEKRKSMFGNSRQNASTSSSDDDQKDGPLRKIYFNQPVPDEEKDENGNLKFSYSRNKIRTAKYTPLSFVPKNLYYQFHNVANIYFFIVIILGVCLRRLLPPPFPFSFS